MGPPQGRAEGEENLPRPAAHTPRDASQETIGLLGTQGTLLPDPPEGQSAGGIPARTARHGSVAKHSHLQPRDNLPLLPPARSPCQSQLLPAEEQSPSPFCRAWLAVYVAFAPNSTFPLTALLSTGNFRPGPRPALPSRQGTIISFTSRLQTEKQDCRTRCRITLPARFLRPNVHRYLGWPQRSGIKLFTRCYLAAI